MRRMFGFAAATLLVACERTGPPPHDPAALSQQDSATALAAGEIATTVAQGLVQQLQARNAQDGAAGAVDFCATMALALTDSFSRTCGAGGQRETDLAAGAQSAERAG